MAECRNCGQKIEFKSHPKNEAKMVPFNPDGGIHFGTCSKPETKRTYESVEEWKCGRGHDGSYFFIGTGGRLGAWCGFKGCPTSWAPDTPGNRKLINMSGNPKYGGTELPF